MQQKQKPRSEKHKTQKNKKKTQKEENLEVLSRGGCYVLSLCVSGLLLASSFIFGSLCVEGLCVTWLLPVLEKKKKTCENSVSDNRGVLVICVKYYGEIMQMFCTYCLVFLCIFISWLGCIQH